MLEGDASGVLLYENILKAADLELSGKQHCCPVTAGQCFPQQSASAAVRLMGANGYSFGATQLLRSPIRCYLENILKEYLSTVSAVLEVFWFIVTL